MAAIKFKHKLSGVLAYLWLWDSAFGSPVLTRIVPLRMMEPLIEMGVITDGSLERMAIAMLIGGIFLITWKVVLDKKASGFGKPKHHHKTSRRRRYVQTSTEPSCDDNHLQDKETSYDHIGQGSIADGDSSSRLGDGLRSQTAPTSLALFGAGAEKPVIRQFDREQSEASTSSAGQYSDEE